jgi:hypothetical protein
MYSLVLSVRAQNSMDKHFLNDSLFLVEDTTKLSIFRPLEFKEFLDRIDQPTPAGK